MARALVPAAVALGGLLALLPGDARAVVGGSAVPAGENGFVAAILSDGSQFCGGSVIADRWVLTAAHCVADGSADGLSVAVGDVDWTAGREIDVTEVVVHPDYDATGASENDVALLHLAADAGVDPVALSDDDALEADGATVTVAGWGSEVPVVGQVPPLGSGMRQVDLAVVGDDACSSAADPATQVCAASFLADSCQGDSGGPLFARTDDGEVQVGVVSYGTGCAIPGFEGVYSEVNASSIRDFIEAHAGV